MRLRKSLVGAVCVLAGLLAACGGSTDGLFGEALYQQSCQSCHNADGSGGVGKAIGEGSAAVDLTDEQIAGVIRAGPGVMPSFPRLTDEQVASLVAHVRRLQGATGEEASE